MHIIILWYDVASQKSQEQRLMPATACLEEQVKLLFRQTPSILLGIVVVSVAIAVSFYSTVEHTVLFAWLAAVYALILLRIFLLYKFKHRQHSTLTTQHWAYIGAFMSFLSGCQWGVGAFLFFTPEAVILVALLTMLLIGMSSGSVASLSAYPPAYIAYSVPSLLSLTIVLFTADNSEYHILGLMTFAFLIVNLNYSRIINKTIITSIDLRHENVDLVENLQYERDKAEEANQAKSKFLAAASHDLRQPLQAISLLSESLYQRLTNVENISIADKISTSVTSLRELFDGLLDVSKLDSGTVTAKHQHFDLEHMINSLLKEFNPIAAEKNIALIVDSQPVTVFSDPLLVKRVLQNLISNALRYTQAGGEIVLYTNKIDSHVELSVKDNGPGIPEDEQKNIFKEFHQLGNPERDRRKGLGLGLSIVKRITDIIGSKIRLNSVAHKETSFTFALPLGNRDKIIQTDRNDDFITNKHADFSGTNVLVIDDEETVRKALVLTLENWGCQTFDYEGINQSDLEGLPEIDLIVSDYRLRNNRDGVQSIEETCNYFNKKIPGILITGDTSPERIVQANDSGHILLHKPINSAQLRIAVTRALNAKGERHR